MPISTKMDNEIDILRHKLKVESEVEVFEGKMKLLREELEALDKKMWKFKIKKFERDSRNYKSDKFYNWTFESRKRNKKVSWKPQMEKIQ